MIDRYMRLYPVAKQFIYQIVVVLQSLGIDSSPTIRNKSRPGNRHPVGINTQLMQKLYIFLVLMVLICSYITRRFVK